MRYATLAAILVAALLFFAFGCTGSTPPTPPGVGNISASPPSDIPPPPPDSGTPPASPNGGEAPPPAPV